MQECADYQFLEKLKVLPFIEAIWLFGSRARGDHRHKSDIDLAILCPYATDSEWLQVLDIIEDADTLLKIDCMRFSKDINPVLYKNIPKEKQILYEKK